ncbi:MAG TPA: hypothetical protein VEL51_02780 [Vicinamibacterales bacterium]|nr:hypothetical protein [Vicinamibacterales bacterium]
MKNVLVALLIASSLMAGACALARATGKPKDSPAMNVPPPPPKIVEPGPEPPPEPVTELPTTPTTSTPASRPNRPPARPAATESKPNEPKPVEPPPEPAPVTPTPTPPPAQLRTPQTADTSSAAKAIRTTIDHANALLNGVNYGPLSNDRKKAYDDAKRFIQQAEEALKQGNLVFAQGVATKAETLARELAGR